MSIKLANNAVTTLASPVLNTDLTLTVAAGTGSKFPTLAAGDSHPLTLIRASDNAVEIVTATARTGDVFTITRAQEGTAALAFVANDRVELRLTATTIDSLPADQVHNATSKATPVDADELLLTDSAASYARKKLTWANLKATVFAALGVLLNAATGKATPVDADSILIQDSAAANATKQLTWANLKATVFAAWGALISAGTAKATPVDADAIAIMDSAAGNATKTLTMANLKAYAGGLTQAAADARYSPIAAMAAQLKNQAVMSTPGGSANMTIGAGSTINNGGGYVMTLASAMTKTTAAWAAGTAQGGLDTGAIAANTWYYFYKIYNPTTATTDVTFSLSNSAPALPTGYTKYGYIGAALTNASNLWYQFVQIGNNFYWIGDFADVSGALSTTPSNYTLTLPRIANIVAKIKANVYNASNAAALRIYGTTQSDIVLATTNASANLQATQSATGATRITGTWDVPITNSSAQVRAVCGEADTVSIYTYGWTDYNI